MICDESKGKEHLVSADDRQPLDTSPCADGPLTSPTPIGGITLMMACQAFEWAP
jgi:hypothetical protein